MTRPSRIGSRAAARRQRTARTTKQTIKIHKDLYKRVRHRLIEVERTFQEWVHDLIVRELETTNDCEPLMRKVSKVSLDDVLKEIPLPHSGRVIEITCCCGEHASVTTDGDRLTMFTCPGCKQTYSFEAPEKVVLGGIDYDEFGEP
jgi:hypothetical protein